MKTPVKQEINPWLHAPNQNITKYRIDANTPHPPCTSSRALKRETSDRTSANSIWSFLLSWRTTREWDMVEHNGTHYPSLRMKRHWPPPTPFSRIPAQKVILKSPVSNFVPNIQSYTQNMGELPVSWVLARCMLWGASSCFLSC